eukprot:2332099-Pyramimonas_sp.AAC.1
MRVIPPACTTLTRRLFMCSARFSPLLLVTSIRTFPSFAPLWIWLRACRLGHPEDAKGYAKG